MPRDSSHRAAAKRAQLKKKRRDRSQPVEHREALALPAEQTGAGTPAAPAGDVPPGKREAVLQPTRGGRRAAASANAMLLRLNYVPGEMKRIFFIFGVILVILVALSILLPRFS